MFRKSLIAPLLLLSLAMLGVSASTWAADQSGGPVTETKVVGNHKLVLQVLPAEPFLSNAQQKAGKPGMVRMGGAAPNREGGLMAPNHHLIVHVLDAQTGDAVTGADVRISYKPLNHPGAKPKNLAVVEMRKNGGGAASTHYGNNVHLSPGRYVVWVRVDHGKVVTFTVPVH